MTVVRDPLLKSILVEEIENLLQKRSNFKGALRRRADWILFNLFHSAKKRWRSSSRSRPQGTQPILESSSIQNDPYKDCNAVHKCRRMVHISGSKRCLFPCSNLPRAQALPLLCFPRPSLSVQGSTIWPVISTKNLGWLQPPHLPFSYAGSRSCHIWMIG